jgi:hypothetical protein
MRMNSEEQRAEQEGWWTRQQRGRKDGTIESTIERTVLYSPHYNAMLCYGRPLLTGSDFGPFSSVVFLSVPSTTIPERFIIHFELFQSYSMGFDGRMIEQLAQAHFEN